MAKPCTSCGESDLPVLPCAICGTAICDLCTLQAIGGEQCCPTCKRLDAKTVALLLSGATVGDGPLPRVRREPAHA